MSDVPTLPTILERMQENIMRGLRVCGPARVESYDAATQSCSAQPLIHYGEINEDGERVVFRPAVVTNVPVMHAGGGGFQFTVPVAVGDTILLVYSDRSLDRLLVRGGEVDPADDRMHHDGDAIAFTGFRDFAHALATAPTDRIRIGYSTGAAKIDITATEVQAGGTAALALHSKLDALWTWVNAMPAGTLAAVPITPAVLGSGTTVLKGG